MKLFSFDSVSEKIVFAPFTKPVVSKWKKEETRFSRLSVAASMAQNDGRGRAGVSDFGLQSSDLFRV